MDTTKKIGSRVLASLLLFVISLSSIQIYANQVPDETVVQDNPLNESDETDEAEDLDDADDYAVIAPDPYQGFNRAMYSFNDKFDIYFLKPIAILYNAIIPKPLNQGIHNFFSNINNVPTIINDVLQAHFFQASSDFWRLGINTTIGIGGLFDVASRLGLEPYTNDFGLTLATWGYKNSNYLVLPFFGPNTIRDGIEIPVDYYAFSIYPGIHSKPVRYGLVSLSIVDRRAQLLKYQSLLEEVSIDPYAFQRNAYMQRRQCQIEENDRLGCGVKERAPITVKENRPVNVNIGT